MLRFLLAIAGVTQLLAPERVIAMYTRLAYEGPEAFTVRSWVVPAIRLEGLVMLYLAVRGLEASEDEAELDQATRANASVPEMFSM